MSDVRALLKAKRQEARITHPYASYTSSTPPQLKCIVCGTVVKHASAWEGHLGSKGHRMGVVRMREEEARAAAAAAAAAEEEGEAEEGDDGGEGMEESGVEGDGEKAGKRKATDETEAHVGKKRKVDPQTTNTNKSFPQDFFSDPSRAPALLSDDSDDDEGEGESAAANAPAAPATAVDLEYERFQRELLTSTAQTDPSEAYDRATVAAEPVAASADVDGFPTMPEADAPAAPAELTEEQSRLKKQEDERELIMDRLLEEERAQEDADARVSLLKAKVEALRRKRELAKATKTKKNAME